MKVNIQLRDENAKVPFKKHYDDFGYDCVATGMEWLSPHIVKYDLGFATQIERDEFMQKAQNANIRLGISGRARSSVWMTGLILSNCIATIDEPYTGKISAVFYKVVEAGEKYVFDGKEGIVKPYEVGDRVLQIYLDNTSNIEWNVVDELKPTERGEGAYGSTGRR